MVTKTRRVTDEKKILFKCPKCGNDSRFVQVMEDVVNLVDGDGNHRHELNASVAYYRCWKCNAIVDDE
jgi:predicted RNA-binding Zn-ribbon protein involved in translation (DUF1610 family)